MKNIIKLWPFWQPGLKYHDQYLADAMKKDDVNTFFFQPKYIPKNYREFAKANLESYDINFLSYFELFGKAIPFRIFNFAKHLRRIKPEVVHIYGVGNFISIFTLISLKIAKIKTKVFFNDHSDPLDRKKNFLAYVYYNFFKLVFFILIKGKYKIIVPDISSKNELVHKYGKTILNQTTIIPLGYDSNVFYNKRDYFKNNKKLTIGFAGKIDQYKNLELLLEVSNYFNEGDIEIHIVGFSEKLTNYQRKLIDYINLINKKNIFTFPFCSTPNDIANFYNSIDVAVFPGSISITTQEATGCGTPILLYCSNEGLEHRVDNQRGILFKSKHDLIKGIKFYMHLKKQKKINHEKISSSSLKYSWNNLKNNYYNLYKLKN